MGKLGQTRAHRFRAGPGIMLSVVVEQLAALCSTGILPVGSAPNAFVAERSNGRSSATLLPIGLAGTRPPVSYRAQSSISNPSHEENS